MKFKLYQIAINSYVYHHHSENNDNLLNFIYAVWTPKKI